MTREDAERIVDALLLAMPGSTVDGIFIMRAMDDTQLDKLRKNWVHLLTGLVIEKKGKS